MANCVVRGLVSDLCGFLAWSYDMKLRFVWTHFSAKEIKAQRGPLSFVPFTINEASGNTWMKVIWEGSFNENTIWGALFRGPYKFLHQKKTVQRNKAREDCRSFNLTRRKTPSEKKSDFIFHFLAVNISTRLASTARLTWQGDFSGWSILLAPPSGMVPHTYSNQN